jgi:uncharacterized protein
MILKLLLVIGVIAIIYFMFIKKKPTVTKKTQQQKKKNEAVDEMVECSSCGVYVTLSEAILSNGKYYCSRECIVKGE